MSCWTGGGPPWDEEKPVKKMLCSLCKKMVDPEGHKWECPVRRAPGRREL